MFFDTTTLYFEGLGPEGLAKLGKSKDYRFDHPQVVVGVVMRRDGLPIACEIWPGNTADVTRLTVVANILKKRFAIDKVVVVCDRGMVSRKSLEDLPPITAKLDLGPEARSRVAIAARRANAKMGART